MAKRVSIKDVALAAGVSVGTVSNVLNRPDMVAQVTRDRVQGAMKELGFIRSESARQLRRGSSNLVGVIVMDLENPFFMSAARGVDLRLRDEACTMVISSSDGDYRRERELISMYNSMNVRGVILTPSSTAANGKRQLSHLIKESSAPVVLMDHPPIDEDCFSVHVDDVAGESQAVTHLLELGHRDIGFVSGPQEIRQSAYRWQGAIQAVKAKGLKPLKTLRIHAAEAFSTRAGEVALKTLVKEHPEITAVACANDLLAIGCLRAARELGIEVPGEMSIVGYDDIQLAQELIVPLTSVRQPMRELGWQAASLLFEQAEKHSVSFEPELIIRESTSAPRA